MYFVLGHWSVLFFLSVAMALPMSALLAEEDPSSVNLKSGKSIRNYLEGPRRAAAKNTLIKRMILNYRPDLHHPILLSFAKGRDTELAPLTIRALLHLGADVPSLYRELKEAGVIPNVLSETIPFSSTHFRVKGDPTLIEFLRGLLETESSDVTDRAMVTLARVGDEQSRPILRRLIESDASKRLAAAGALLSGKWTVPEEDMERVFQLPDALIQPLRHAIRLNKKPVLEWVRKQFYSSDSERSSKAAEILATGTVASMVWLLEHHRNPERIDDLIQIGVRAKSENRNQVREKRSVLKDSQWKVIVGSFEKENPIVRLAAIRVLGSVRVPFEVFALAMRTFDSLPEAQREALYLRTIANNVIDRTAKLCRELEDSPSLPMSLRALRELAKHRSNRPLIPKIILDRVYSGDLTGVPYSFFDGFPRGRPKPIEVVAWLENPEDPGKAQVAAVWIRDNPQITEFREDRVRTLSAHWLEGTLGKKPLSLWVAKTKEELLAALAALKTIEDPKSMRERLIQLVSSRHAEVREKAMTVLKEHPVFRDNASPEELLAQIRDEQRSVGYRKTAGALLVHWFGNDLDAVVGMIQSLPPTAGILRSELRKALDNVELSAFSERGIEARKGLVRTIVDMVEPLYRSEPRPVDAEWAIRFLSVAMETLSVSEGLDVASIARVASESHRVAKFTRRLNWTGDAASLKEIPIPDKPVVVRVEPPPPRRPEEILFDFEASPEERLAQFRSLSLRAVSKELVDLLVKSWLTDPDPDVQSGAYTILMEQVRTKGHVTASNLRAAFGVAKEPGKHGHKSLQAYHLVKKWEAPSTQNRDLLWGHCGEKLNALANIAEKTAD